VIRRSAHASHGGCLGFAQVEGFDLVLHHVAQALIGGDAPAA
jgi:hypothetical protein